MCTCVAVGYPADFPVVLFGRSIGSVCAIHLAARFPTQFHGLIIESGIASLLELPMVAMLAAGMPMVAVLVSRLPDPWANKAKMASVSIRTLIIHGERDEISPVRATAGRLSLMLFTRARVLTVLCRLLKAARCLQRAQRPRQKRSFCGCEPATMTCCHIINENTLRQ
jgi:pimeloyl-ACP methyl ester carboxylesterase